MSKRERDPFEVYRDECIYAITSDRSLAGSQVRVAVVIALHLNRHTGEAWPSEETLAKLSGHGQDRRNLSRDLKGLSRHIEVISREAGAGRKTTHYRFKTASPVMHLDDPEIASPMTHLSADENASPMRENASRASRKCVTGDARPLKTTETTPDPGEEGGHRSANAPRAFAENLSPEEAVKAANHRCHDCDHEQEDTPCPGSLSCLGLIPSYCSSKLYPYNPGLGQPSLKVTVACKQCEERETDDWPLGGIKKFIEKKKRDFAQWKAAQKRSERWTPNKDTPTCSSCGSFQVEIARIAPLYSSNITPEDEAEIDRMFPVN
jgi:hypothetical protein